MTAIAVLLIVGGAAVAGLLALRLDSRTPMLVFKHEVPVGAKITPGMFAQADVSSDGLDLVEASQLDQVTGLYLRQTGYAGQLLDTKMLSRRAPIKADKAQVGIPLSGGKVPPGLRSGDEVRLLQIGDQGEPSRALCTGLVLRVSAGKSGGFATGETASVATVLVPQSTADSVVGAAGNDSLGAALIKRGVSVQDADITPLGGG